MNRTPRIFLAGELCIDNNIIEGKKKIGWGSSIMYISHYLNDKYGVVCDAFSPYGSDFIGYLDHKINILNKPTSKRTLLYKNMVKSGFRKQVCIKADNIELPKIDVPGVIRKLSSCDLIIIAPMTPWYSSRYVSELISHTSSESMKVLLPQGYMRNINVDNTISLRRFNEVSELVGLFDLIILSSEDTENAFKQAEEWVSENTKLEVIITQAGKGVTLVSVGGRLQIPTNTIPVEEIENPVGGGDIFSACVAIEKLLNSTDTVESIKEAHIATSKVLRGC